MRQFLIAVDQLINTVIGGKADETLSARAHRMRLKRHKHWGWAADFIDLLFFWQKDDQGLRNHCLASYESELGRRHLPRHYTQI